MARELRPDSLDRVRVPVYISRRALEERFGARGVSGLKLSGGAMNFSELTSVFVTLCDTCLVLAVAATVFTLVESFLVLRFSAGRCRLSSAQPAVTILKPLHGAEPGLLERLTRFCKQDYAGPVQL